MQNFSFCGKLGFFLFIAATVIAGNVLAEEDAGSETCNEFGDCDEEVHNLWTLHEKESLPEDSGPEDAMIQYFQKNGVTMKPLELKLILKYLASGENEKVGLEDLERVQEQANDPFKIVTSVVKSFENLDKNDDGVLKEDEMSFVTDPEEVTFQQYLAIISRLDSSIHRTLKPFEGMSFLGPLELKKVVSGSVKTFEEKDEDKSGGLSMAEFLKQVDRPDNTKGRMLDDQQKEAFFRIIDRDNDGEINFSEFLAVIPQGNPANDVDKLFSNADIDGDGFWTQGEFQAHLQDMILKTGSPQPQQSEIEEAFKHLDSDRDGRISKDEMKGIQKQIEKIQEEKATQGFEELDTDGDGELSREEVGNMAALMEQRTGQLVNVEMLIKMIDLNGNERVELDEVKEMMRRLPPMAKARSGLQQT